jgi:hypothetical protein
LHTVYEFPLLPNDLVTKRCDMINIMILYQTNAEFGFRNAELNPDFAINHRFTPLDVYYLMGAHREALLK